MTTEVDAQELTDDSSLITNISLSEGAVTSAEVLKTVEVAWNEEELMWSGPTLIGEAARIDGRHLGFDQQA